MLVQNCAVSRSAAATCRRSAARFNHGSRFIADGAACGPWRRLSRLPHGRQRAAATARRPIYEARYEGSGGSTGHIYRAKGV